MTTEEVKMDKNNINNYIEETSKKMLERLPSLGPILTLYLQSQHRRYQFVSDMEWLLFPPLMLDQCKLYMKNKYPISFVSWAFIDDDAEKRLLQSGGKLRHEDWNCGERICLIDILAPFGGVEMVLQDLQKNVFPEKTFNLLMPDIKTGGVSLREVQLPDSSTQNDEK